MGNLQKSVQVMSISYKGLFKCYVLQRKVGDCKFLEITITKMPVPHYSRYEGMGGCQIYRKKVLHNT